MIFCEKQPSVKELVNLSMALSIAHQLRISIGACIRDLEISAKAGEPEDLMSKIQFLPL
jgi:hypothetical protein